jgi:hypothetical protein
LRSHSPERSNLTVTDFVVAMLLAATKDNDPYPQLETEALIRAALGETDVDLSGISRGARLSIRLLAAIVATNRMGSARLRWAS